MRVVSGCLVEVGQDSEIVLGNDRSVVTPPGRSHRLHNPLPIEATMVHAYSPPLEAMTYYPDRDGRDQHPAGRGLPARTRQVLRPGAEATTYGRLHGLRPVEKTPT